MSVLTWLFSYYYPYVNYTGNDAIPNFSDALSTITPTLHQPGRPTNDLQMGWFSGPDTAQSAYLNMSIYKNIHYKS
jgi:hypothetical protein